MILNAICEMCILHLLFFCEAESDYFQVNKNECINSKKNYIFQPDFHLFAVKWGGLNIIEELTEYNMRNPNTLDP